MIIGYFADSFDLINVRDLDLIAQAAARCSRLVVGVYSDDYSERCFGRRPVVPFAERAALVSHVRGVDAVVTHEDERPAAEEPEVVFTAADRTTGPQRSTVVLIPRAHTQSSILRRALDADQEWVA